MRTRFAILLAFCAILLAQNANSQINQASVSYVLGVIDGGDSYLKEQGYENPEYVRLGWYEEDLIKLSGIAFFQSDSVILSFRKNSLERWNNFNLKAEKVIPVYGGSYFYDFSNGYRGRMSLDGEERWKFFLYTDNGTFYFTGPIF